MIFHFLLRRIKMFLAFPPLHIVRQSTFWYMSFGAQVQEYFSRVELEVELEVGLK